MSWANYDDVLDQLRDDGLDVRSLVVGSTKPERCYEIDGDREKRGWYWLTDIKIGDEYYIVGSYGIYHGKDSGKTKVKLGKKTKALSDEQRAAINARHKENARKAKALRDAKAKRAARQAVKAWNACSTTGECEYLVKKQVDAYDVRFSPKNALVIAIRDISTNIHGLQIIHSDPEIIKKKGRNKDYWPKGLVKSGNFHLIGNLTKAPIILIVEGYATGASIKKAVERLPVVVAFDAPNLMPVCQVIRKRYPQAKILICADDDFATWKNPGDTSASLAAVAVSGEHVLPEFTDDPLRASVKQAKKEHDPSTREEWKEVMAPLLTGRQKKTDFNDLHTSEGLTLVTEQIEEKIKKLGWDSDDSTAPATQTRGEGDDSLLPITSTDELLDRFALVYGHGGTVFDDQERKLVKLGDMRDACTSNYIHQEWAKSLERKLVRVENVGFDPSGKDPAIKCNLYDNWPTRPEKGKCDLLLELLEYLCSGEENSRELYKWVLCWLAYPIQNPGAKMRTALILHGPQGVGKNIFFEAVMAIYGKYGRVIDQAAIEDKYNDWASKKLFLIADEVVARQELFHTKNKLKAFITSDWIRINPKHVTAYEERNHVNLVFLSNETQPLVLERDDRRYTVIWTPAQLPVQVYIDAAEERDSGGIEALHEYLLNLDLKQPDGTPFTEHSKPPMTKAKQALIDLSMDSTERFWRLWVNGELECIPVVPCLSRDLYQLYKEYCRRIGYTRYAPEPKLLEEIKKRSGVTFKRAEFMGSGGIKTQRAFIFPPRAEMPADTTQIKWLTGCVEEFREGFKQWKDEGNVISMEAYRQ